ncbi:hypothetical protein D4T97_003090 [Siminovitchia acidinfaciens]|uniref:Uncharacterized protein n=1 Tax=Siminovitchia acidinfaciens TaxID=2321395 RepID=A0A429Y851_9BACI|nr:hypothetical protein [Siminovitchia acidinfaciens]RST77484.1 hypothetical protein D4T97_003090 [Siminovitchia acidinfaciens]
MGIYDILSNLAETYEKLEEGFYSYGDYPAPEKLIRNDPYISISTFNGLIDIIMELDEFLGGSRVTREIIELIEEDSAISNLVNFDEQDHASERINQDIEAYDENLGPTQENASQQAHEIKSELLDVAMEDIRRLMEEILPSLIR